jgi:hypothetical protein
VRQQGHGSALLARVREHAFCLGKVLITHGIFNTKHILTLLRPHTRCLLTIFIASAADIGASVFFQKQGFWITACSNEVVEERTALTEAWNGCAPLLCHTLGPAGYLIFGLTFLY